VKYVPRGVKRKNPPPTDRKKPAWLKVGLPTGPKVAELRTLVNGLGLHTVCQEALCPNLGECWGHGTMTIMILGEVCTRACKFCAVHTGNPGGRLDPTEPQRVAEAVARLRLGYVVLTSVDRDDLADGGAGQFAATIRAIRRAWPRARIETLTPDFQGDLDAVRTVLDAGPDVFAHNLETVRRLTPRVRDPRAGYDQSLEVLHYAHRYREEQGLSYLTKSSLMVGLGESDEELMEAMADLRAAGVEVLTLGQYLRPTPSHLPVARYVPPEDFERYREWGLAMGFSEAFAGPLVRSSYRAERVFLEAKE